MCKIMEDMRHEAAREAAQKAKLKSARKTAERQAALMHGGLFRKSIKS